MSLFITLEGPDGSGKSSQAAELAAWLTELGYDVLLTREPGGTPISEQIRRILTALDNTSMHPRTEFLLFSASRAQHVHECIRPHLEQGGVVISDRFFDASLAYQGHGHGLDLHALNTITAFATSDLTPDLTLLLDLPVEEGLRRREKDGDWNRLDAYDLEFHRRVRAGYQALAQSDPQRWVQIDARQPFEAVQAHLRQALQPRLPPKNTD